MSIRRIIEQNALLITIASIILVQAVLADQTTYIQGQYVSIGDVLNLTTNCHFGHVYAVQISTGNCSSFESTCQIPDNWVQVNQCNTNIEYRNITIEKNTTIYVNQSINCTEQSEGKSNPDLLTWLLVAACLITTSLWIAEHSINRRKGEKNEEETELLGDKENPN